MENVGTAAILSHHSKYSQKKALYHPLPSPLRRGNAGELSTSRGDIVATRPPNMRHHAVRMEHLEKPADPLWGRPDVAPSAQPQPDRIVRNQVHVRPKPDQQLRQRT